MKKQLANITQNKDYIQTRTIRRWNRIFKKMYNRKNKGKKAKEFLVSSLP